MLTTVLPIPTSSQSQPPRRSLTVEPAPRLAAEEPGFCSEPTKRGSVVFSSSSMNARLCFW